MVTRPVVDWLRAFYAHYLGANQGNLFYQTAIGAGHAQVTVGYGGDCNINGGVFINKCGYDQAGVILQHIYGALQPRNDGALTGQFLAFNQGDFTAPDRAAERSMDNTGFVYAPASCVAKEPCRVHVVLHGCLQSFNNISDNFIRNAGYNEWADTNRIIVLYPQIRAPSLARWGLWAPMMGGITNPQSCWDWWGYLDPNPMTSPTYLLKSGRQISAIKAMVDRLTGGLVAVTSPAVTPGAAPETVRVVDRTDTAIALVWSVVPGVARFEVFRADAEDAAFRLIGMVAGLSFADAELQAGTSYRYRVRALGGSALSAIASGATLPAVPRCDEPGRCAVR